MPSDRLDTDKAGVVLTILQAKIRLGEARITGSVDENDKTRVVFFKADDGTEYVLTRKKP